MSLDDSNTEDNVHQFQLGVLEQIPFYHSLLHGGVYIFLYYGHCHQIGDHLHKVQVMLHYPHKHNINHIAQDLQTDH